MGPFVTFELWKGKQEINLLIHFTPDPRVPEFLARIGAIARRTRTLIMALSSAAASRRRRVDCFAMTMTSARRNWERREGGSSRNWAPERHAVWIDRGQGCNGRLHICALSPRLLNYQLSRDAITANSRCPRESMPRDRRCCGVDDARFEIIYCRIVASRTGATSMMLR